MDALDVLDTAPTPTGFSSRPITQEDFQQGTLSLDSLCLFAQVVLHCHSLRATDDVPENQTCGCSFMPGNIYSTCSETAMHYFTFLLAIHKSCYLHRRWWNQNVFIARSSGVFGAAYVMVGRCQNDPRTIENVVRTNISFQLLYNGLYPPTEPAIEKPPDTDEASFEDVYKEVLAAPDRPNEPQEELRASI